MTQEENKQLPQEEKPESVSKEEFSQVMQQLKALTQTVQQLSSMKLEQDKVSKEEKEEKLSLASLQKTIDLLKKEKEEETNQKRDLQLRNSVKEQLASLNIAPHLQKAAMAVLVDSDRLISYDDNGSLIFKGKYGNQDLSEGLKSWAKTDEAKAFQTPKGAMGSGDRVHQNSPPKISNNTELGQLLIDAHNSGVL